MLKRPSLAEKPMPPCPIVCKDRCAGCRRTCEAWILYENAKRKWVQESYDYFAQIGDDEYGTHGHRVRTKAKVKRNQRGID